MLTYERRQRILEYIEENGAASVAALSEHLGASESTIRRDLAELSNLGKINKVHGGATATTQEFHNREDTIGVKVKENLAAKTAIAEYAASLINDDDYVFIDAGSTTFLMTTFIKNTKATFITNGLAHASELAKNGCRVTVIGGDLKHTTEAITGAVALSNISRYNFSKAFIGVNGATVKQGYTTPDPNEAAIKAAAIDRSFVSYVLADSTKFGKFAAVTVSPLDTSCIICDRCRDAEIKNKTVVKEVD